MEKDKPLISIIVATYNRAKTISRAIDSILAQTYDNFEIIIVDDGSADDTLKILSKYNDAKIKIIKHEINKGVCAAKNTGFNHISGEWFTLLDSDDEMVPTALETMIKVPAEIDKGINAITCNCIDSSTGKMSGKGSYKDQYLDAREIATKFVGEHWGLTKASLLGTDRLNERLPGYEGTLWYKINEKAKRYYIHRALRIYHTEGNDRVTNSPKSLQERIGIMKSLKTEPEYLSALRKYHLSAFTKMCFDNILVLKAANDTDSAKYYYYMLKESDCNILIKILAALIILLDPKVANGIIFIGRGVRKVILFVRIVH